MNDVAPAPAVYKIPAYRLSLFTEKFEALQRRAAKLGCPVPQADVGELAVMKVVETDPLDGERYVTYVEYYPVTVAGKAPSYAGWTFLAVVDYEAAAPTFRKTPAADAFEIPLRHREMGPVCEHCNVDRRRTETFIVRHEDGRVVQVGRQCLRDFLGHESPWNIAALAELEASVRASLSSGAEDGGGLFGPGPFTPDVEAYLAWVVWSINRWGWVSRKAASDFGKPATATAASEAFEKYLKGCREGRGDRAAKPGEGEKTRAAEVLAWARALGDGEARTLSDYEHNLKTICGLGRVGRRHFGLVASAVAAFDREAARRKAVLNEHVGKVGERLRGVRVFVDRVIGLADSDYGTSIVVMRGLAGHAFKWFTSRVPDTGREYEMTATVKEHGEWKGTLQTIVSRAELQADDEPTKAERRHAETLDMVLRSAASRLSWEPIQWKGIEAFTARRVAAAKDINLVDLEALRAELHDLAAAIEPVEEPSDDAARLFVSLVRRLVRAQLAAVDPAQVAKKVKPADKALAHQIRASLQEVVGAVGQWPFSDTVVAVADELAAALPDHDLAGLTALRAEVRAHVAVLVPRYGADKADGAEQIAKHRQDALAALDAPLAVPTGANPAAAQRLHKALCQAVTILTCRPFGGWDGSDDFQARARDAVDRCDAVALAALRDELVALAPTIGSREDYRASEEVLARYRGEALAGLLPKKRAAATAETAPASA